MTNFAILSRIKARQALAKQEFVPEVKTDEKTVDLVKIAMRDLETGIVVKEFGSIDEAIAEGFSKPNLVGALKNGNKYKGHLWTTIK